VINASSAGVRGTQPRYSLVIPIFNEEAVLPLLIRRIVMLLDTLDAGAEAIFVDDGSSDTSVIYLRGMVAEEPALSADRTVAQFRTPDRHHRRHGRGRR